MQTRLLLAFALIIAGASAWMDPSWQYRTPVTVSNGGSAQTDYQVSVTLNTSTLISAGKMRSDCGDLRFANSSDSALSYWIESGCNTTNTKIWVRAPYVPNGTSTVYAYYGGSSASYNNTLGGNSTFLLFDDFESGIIGWTRVGGSSSLTQSPTAYQGSYSAYQGGGSDSYWVKNLSAGMPTDFVVDFAMRPTTYSSWFDLASSGNANLAGFKDSSNGAWQWYDGSSVLQVGGGMSVSFDGSPSAGTWYSLRIRYLGSISKWYPSINGAEYGPFATGSGSPAELSIQNSNWGAGTGYYDAIRVRRYALPEPTTSLQAEQPRPTVIFAGISPASVASYPSTQQDFALWVYSNQTFADNFTLSCTGTCYYSENPVAVSAQQNKSVTVTIPTASVSGTTNYQITAVSQANALNNATASFSITVDATTWRSQWTDAFNNTFTYRTPITVSNNGSALTDYQVPINISNLVYNNSGLVGSWHFSEGSGNRAADSSGLGNDGTLVNNPAWVVGKSGKGLQLDGSTQYVSVAHNPSLTFGTGSFTFAAWIYRAGAGGAMLGKRGVDDASQPMFVFGCDTSTLGLELSAAGAQNYQYFPYPGGCPAGGWHYVVAQRNSTHLSLYLDGQYLNSTPSLGANIDNSYNLYIGARGRNGQAPWGWFGGTIDEVRIYNRSLSAQEISALYGAGKLKLDYSDLRFANSSISSIPYWLESDNRAWVKVPYLPNGTSTVYAYYGSPGAASASSGNATFNVFEDFSQDGTNPPAGWTRMGTATWDASNFYMDNNNAGNQQKITYKGGQTLTSAEWQWKYYAYGNSYQITKFLGTTAAGTGGSHQELNAWSVYNDFNGNAYLMHGTGSNYDYVTFSGLAVNSWGYIRVRHVDGGGWNVDVSSDGQVWVNKLSNVMSPYTVMSNPVVFGAQEHNTNNYGRIDDIRVRRYASPEPTGALLLEESSNPFAILGVSPASKTTSPNYNETFSLWAYNNQTFSDTFTLSCAGTCSVSPSTLPLISYQNGSANVAITSANASGTTTYTVTATSQANASNAVSITAPLTVDATKWRSNWTDAYGREFKYRVPITINNSGSALTDYQVNVTLDTAAPIGLSRMRGDCGDLRVTNGTNEMPYWVESGCNTTSTKIWARAPYVPVGNSTIYAYYGSSAAANASNGTATFEFFDDFEDGTLGKWATPGSATIVTSPVHSGAKAVLANNAAATISKKWGVAGNKYELDFWMYDGGQSARSEVWGGLGSSAGASWRFLIAARYDNTYWTYVAYPSSYVNTPFARNKYAYSKVTIIYDGGSSIKYTVNDGALRQVTNSWSDGVDNIWTGLGWGGQSEYLDDFRVRKYSSPEPSVLAGAEQSKGYRTLVRRCGMKQANATVTAYQAGIPVKSCVADPNGICSLEISAGAYDLQFIFTDNSTAWKNGTTFS